MPPHCNLNEAPCCLLPELRLISLTAVAAAAAVVSCGNAYISLHNRRFFRGSGRE